MDITQIMKHLPHRYPFLLVDRVLELVPNERIVALKNITMNEPQFTGHFPHHPVMPGVLMIEALAQTAGLLAFKSAEMPVDENTVIYFVGIDGARFKRPVQPGDQLRMEASILRVTRGIWKFAAKATVEGQIACEAELMCTLKQLD
ncbi:MAG: 3-hydroxyacyl-[acyl-carrier-protein] dehydratase FabZ [Hydrogenophilales bacterium CG_4_9_14_3_um_filter_63_34]|nr:MAG: 3-hydroxyacyl-[acyl-carrier-protein] dehydratase FabZ [Hydrogenophilales bacterium CG_4_10_14_3_um_filter_63_21]PJB04776.1 MAG: 3-hydroxyacyl-[acyl-carrier-protein] dehydratase FabZ [Hydrogenophilales bacterium CG_4_9_14_3_um_filter_63_34]